MDRSETSLRFQSERANRHNLNEVFGRALMVAESRQYNYDSAMLDNHLSQLVIRRLDNSSRDR